MVKISRRCMSSHVCNIHCKFNRLGFKVARERVSLFRFTVRLRKPLVAAPRKSGQRSANVRPYNSTVYAKLNDQTV